MAGIIPADFLLLSILLLSVHLGVPLVYYLYLKARWYRMPWNIKIDETYVPTVSIITPTRNESQFIEKRLENIYEQEYARELIEVIVVDSASNDGTVGIVRDWSRRHSRVRVVMVEERAREGKMAAVSKALKCAAGAVVMIGDADSVWALNAIRNSVKYFADPSVGALTASLRYSTGEGKDVENTYRDFYNVLRVAESKMCSTPVHSGVLLAIRKEFLEGFKLPSYAGAEDCAVGSYAAFVGYRAVQADDVWAYEPLRGSYLGTKIRRAQHNILNFLLTKGYAKRQGGYLKSSFDTIWDFERYLYLVNPFLLLSSLVLMLYCAAVLGQIAAVMLLGAGGFLLLMSGTFRMWVLQQFYIIVAATRCIWTRETVWSK